MLTNHLGSTVAVLDNNSVTSNTGILGNAAHFDNANGESLSHADVPELSVGNEDFTFSAWVNLDDLDSDHVILGKFENGVDQEYLLYFESSTPQRFKFIVYDASNNYIGGVSADNLGVPEYGTWYHIVAYHDATNDLLGIIVDDGTPDTSATTGSKAPGDQDSDFVVGCKVNNVSCMDGLIDEVGFWKRLLTSGEISALYNGGNGRSFSFGYYTPTPSFTEFVQTPVAPGSGSSTTIQNDSSDIDYYNNWTETSQTGSSEGTIHVADINGAIAQFTFTGNKFIFKYSTEHDYGYANVYVDGSLAASINQYSASPQTQQTSTFNVAWGTHQVLIVRSGINGGGNDEEINLDAVIVYNDGTPTSTSAPTSTPTGTPSLTPTPSPTTAPAPTSTPTPGPTNTSTSTPTPTPTPNPTLTPTPAFDNAAYEYSGSQPHAVSGVIRPAGGD